jgi:NhaP-type Na+/H+ or K+/H+ antiporter
MVQTSPHISKFVKDLVLLDVAGVALLTLIINASSTEWLVKKLGLTAQSEIQQNILLTLIANTNKNLIDNIVNIKGQNIDEHSLVDWKAV